MTGEFVDPDMIDAYAEMRGRIMIEMKKSFRSCLSTIAPRSWSLFAFKLYRFITLRLRVAPRSGSSEDWRKSFDSNTKRSGIAQHRRRTVLEGDDYHDRRWCPCELPSACGSVKLIKL